VALDIANSPIRGLNAGARIGPKMLC
jgi:hypothetical protein